MSKHGRIFGPSREHMRVCAEHASKLTTEGGESRVLIYQLLLPFDCFWAWQLRCPLDFPNLTPALHAEDPPPSHPPHTGPEVTKHT